MEVWKDIEGFEGYYQVSNLGRVKSLERYVNHKICGKKLINERIMRQSVDSYGYNISGLCKNGKLINVKVHRLVCTAFLPNPNNKPQVNHKNGNKSDNTLQNLEWVTNSENQKHAYENGLNKSNPNRKFYKGSEHWKSKLTENDILLIRTVYKDSSVSKLAEIFKISKSVIFGIKKYTSWKHVM